MSQTDRLLAAAVENARGRERGSLPAPPALRVAVVACMDARLDVYRIFGLNKGDAHVIRNAGGTVTDDVIRSLAVSQRMLGTREVILLHHRGCGMQTFTDDEFNGQMEADTGVRPPWAVETFEDVEDHVRQCLDRLRTSPFIPSKESMRGFVYDVETGALEEVGEADVGDAEVGDPA